jgi:hypothetical protein
MVKMTMFALDTKSQGQQRDRRESWALQQGAQGEARILQGLFDPRNGPLVAMQFFGLLNAAVCAARFESRISGFHALSFEFVLKHCQMSIHFARQVTLGRSVTENVLELRETVPHGSPSPSGLPCWMETVYIIGQFVVMCTDSDHMTLNQNSFKRLGPTICRVL